MRDDQLLILPKLGFDKNGQVHLILGFSKKALRDMLRSGVLQCPMPGGFFYQGETLHRVAGLTMWSEESWKLKDRMALVVEPQKKVEDTEPDPDNLTPKIWTPEDEGPAFKPSEEFL